MKYALKKLVKIMLVMKSVAKQDEVAVANFENDTNELRELITELVEYCKTVNIQIKRDYTHFIPY